MTVWPGVLVLVTLVAACHLGDQPENHHQDLDQSIIGGTISPSDHAVVALIDNDNQFCTGTLITPSIVLTAAHCLPPHTSSRLEEIDVFFGADLSQGGERIAIRSARAHPDWKPDALANDIGILALAIPSSYIPIEMVANVDELGLVDSSARVVGYGVTSNGGRENGIRRSGTMFVKDIDASSIYLSPGPTLTCSGDSGGPLLAKTAVGEVIVGVHSRSNCSTTSLAERLDIHLVDFIGEFMSENNSGASCDVDGRCMTGCQEVDPDCGKPVDTQENNLVGGCQAVQASADSLIVLLLVLTFPLLLTSPTTRQRRHLAKGSDQESAQKQSGP